MSSQSRLRLKKTWGLVSKDYNPEDVADAATGMYIVLCGPYDEVIAAAIRKGYGDDLWFMNDATGTVNGMGDTCDDAYTLFVGLRDDVEELCASTIKQFSLKRSIKRL